LIVLTKTAGILRKSEWKSVKLWPHYGLKQAMVWFKSQHFSRHLNLFSPRLGAILKEWIPFALLLAGLARSQGFSAEFY
jgi:hypothetical protein